MIAHPLTKLNLISLAVIGALSTGFSPVASAADSYLQNDIGEKEVTNVGSGDNLIFGNTGTNYTNNGTIEGEGTLEHQYIGQLINNGKIDVANYKGWGYASGAIVNNKTGIVNVRDGNLGMSINNSGVITSGTKSLNFSEGLKVSQGSKILQSDEKSTLDAITIGGNYFTVEEGATLKANKIVSNTTTQDTISGAVLADEIEFSKTTYITKGRLEGKAITLKETYAKEGAVINASDKVSFNGFSEVKDSTLSSPIISNPNSALYLQGTSKVEGVQRFEIGSSLGIQSSDVRINENNRVEEVVFLAKEDGSKPSIYLEKEQNLSIGTLTVNKSVKEDGTVVTARLVDKTTPKNEGDTSFNVDNIQIKDGAILSIYADNKTDKGTFEKRKSSLTLGQVDIGVDGELQLGWRDGSYMGFASQSIESLTLADNAKVTTDKSAQNAIVGRIGVIAFNGSNAAVETTLTGSSTDILIKEGAIGNTISSVATDKVNVTLEKTAKDSLHVTHTGDKTVVNVVATPENNSGDAQKDLNEIAQSVVFDDKKAHNVTQEADDMNDAFSGTVIDGKVGNVKVEANSNINGIAEMTAVGLHIWRNEINDMNKRLGELRDSSDDANGVWARVYNGKAKFGDQKITNKYTAFQFGYDRQVADGLWLGGAMSWTDGDSDFAVGGGDNSLMALTAYGSKLWDNGMFVDVTGKFGRIKNEFDIRLANGRSNADYDANAVSVSAEAGWRVYPLNNAFFVEPQVEMMYGRVESVDYTTSTGVKVNQDSAETLIGRAGFVMGLKCPADRGNAYVRASVLHDWEGDANFKFSKDGVNSRAISESLGGTWYEYGIGANFNATKQLHIYADVEAANGGEVDTDYRVNLGMRYSF